MFYTDLILNWLGKLPNPFQVFWPSDLRVLKDVLYLCVCLNWIPCCHSTLPPGIMIWGNSNLTLLGELHVSVFPIVWYKREKKNYQIFFVHLFTSKFNLIVALFYLQESYFKKRKPWIFSTKEGFQTISSRSNPVVY